jgi:hypothetical protein
LKRNRLIEKLAFRINPQDRPFLYSELPLMKRSGGSSLFASTMKPSQGDIAVLKRIYPNVGDEGVGGRTS